MAFSFKDLGAINESIDRFGNSVVESDMRRDRAKQQEVENELRRKADTRADKAQTDMETYRKGQLENTAAATKQRGDAATAAAAAKDAAAKAKAEQITAAAAAKGENFTLQQIDNYFKNANESLAKGTVSAEEQNADLQGLAKYADPKFLEIAKRSPHWNKIDSAKSGKAFFQAPPAKLGNQAKPPAAIAIEDKIKSLQDTLGTLNMDDPEDAKLAVPIQGSIDRLTKQKKPDYGKTSTRTELNPDGTVKGTVTTQSRPMGPLDAANAKPSSPGYRAGTAGGAMNGYTGRPTTSQPPAAAPAPAVAPTQPAAPPTAAPVAPPQVTPDEKIAMANRIKQSHPEWSREQVIAEVKRLFK